MKNQQLVILLLLATTLTAIPLSLTNPSARAVSTKHFVLEQMNSSFGPLHCGGGSNTLCFNDTVPGPTLTVNQGDVVNITVHNTDTTSHTFTLAAPYGSENIVNSAGQTQSIQFTANTAEPGGIVYMCTFPGHSAAGMHGTFTVTPAASISPTSLLALLGTTTAAVFITMRKRR